MQLHRGAYIVIYKSGSVQNVTRLCTEWNVLAQIGEALYKNKGEYRGVAFVAILYRLIPAIIKFIMRRDEIDFSNIYHTASSLRSRDEGIVRTFR